MIPLGLCISQRESISRDNSRARSHPQLSRNVHIHRIRALEEGFLTPELVVSVAELVAMAETLEELEAEEAATGP
jgi:hypothetical protein